MKKVNVCVRPVQCWLTTAVNLFFARVRGLTTPVPTSMAIGVAPGVMKTEVHVGLVTAKTIARAERFINTCHQLIITDVLNRRQALTAIS